jgi:hypothetical protein
MLKRRDAVGKSKGSRERLQFAFLAPGKDQGKSGCFRPAGDELTSVASGSIEQYAGCHGWEAIISLTALQQFAFAYVPWD